MSDDIDIEDALEAVLHQCTAQLGDTKPQVGVLFTSCMDVDFTWLLGSIMTAFPGIELVGCTTDGELCRETGFLEDALALLLLSSDTVQFGTAVATDISQDPARAFASAFSSASRRIKGKPACALTFPDGLTTIGTALDTAIHESFGKGFPVFGGTAGDHFLFTGTYQFHNNRVYQDAAPVLVFGGEVHFAFSVNKGPVPTGLSFNLDRHAGNVVYEIDGKTATAFYREYLGDMAEQLTQFPLAVYEKGSEDYYLRDPLIFNQDDESITFVGNFPDNCQVRLTLVSRTDVLNSADTSNRAILQNDKITPELLLIFSCTSQRHVLGSKTNEKFSLLNAHSNIPYFGFYCYGEIAPLTPDTPTFFHNDTYVILALGSNDT